MPKPRQFEKPMGVRDFLPDFVNGKKWVEKQVGACFFFLGVPGSDHTHPGVF